MLGKEDKICSICSKKEHHAKGMCGSCYSKNLKLFSKKKCEICGSSNYHGKGLCKACYSKEITEPKDKEKRKKYREENPIIEQKDLICVSCSKKGCYSKNMCRQCYNHNYKDVYNPRRQSLYKKNSKIINKKRKEKYDENKEKHNKKARIKYNKNKEQILKRQYKYKKIRLENDPYYKLKESLSSRIRGAIRKQKGDKDLGTIELLGAPIKKVREYIEKQFDKEMCWDNWGRVTAKKNGYKNYWQIDHFVPLAAFDLHNIKHKKIVCHYTNLQPLWWRENNKKSDTIPLGWSKDGN